MKKFICSLLALLLFVLPLAACTDDDVGEETSESTVESTPSDETEGEVALDLPDDLRFDGQKVVFLCRNDAEWTSDDIYSQGGGGDTISNAVFERNELVRNRLGVEIQQLWADGDEVITKVQQAVTTGLDDFHVVVSHAANASQMATAGYLRDLNSQTISHLDLTKSYWDQNLTRELSMDGRLYFATGDIMTIDNDATFCLLFNKTIASDNKLPDLYKLVEDKEWTLAKQYELADKVATDSSSADRTYGLVRTADTGYAIYFGGGVRVISRATDSDSFVFALDVQRAESIANIAKNLLSSEVSVNITSMATKEESVMALGQKYFGGGHALFYSDVMQSVERMRAFDLDFGVLPNPLYDSNQSSYYHMMHYTGNVISIPRSSKIRDGLLERITATLEAMAYYSIDTLTTQYYDINLTSKYINDPESKPMIDLILETRVYDLAYYYNITGSYGNITSELAAAMGSGRGIASLYRSYSRIMDQKIAQFIESMNKHAEKYGE